MQIIWLRAKKYFCSPATRGGAIAPLPPGKYADVNEVSEAFALHRPYLSPNTIKQNLFNLNSICL